MSLQIIKDSFGKKSGVFIPIEEWEELTKKHAGLLDLIEPEFYSENEIRTMSDNFKLSIKQHEMLENASNAEPERYRTIGQLKQHIENKYGIRV